MKQKLTAMSAWERFLPAMPDKVLEDESQRRVVQHIFFSGMLAATQILDPDMSSDRAKELLYEIQQLIGPGENSGER